MVREYFYYVSFAILVAIAGLSLVWPAALYALLVAVPLIGLGSYDVFCRHNVLRNYPVIGHMRYMLEFIRPELRQYFFESEFSGRPFNRQQRSWVNGQANGQGDVSPFGTRHDVTSQGFVFAHHSLHPQTPAGSSGQIRVGGPQCRQPYEASRFNISAMSFGSLSSHAILAFNKGAARGGFAHDTGEGGISEYHLRHGGDLIWEIGTAYYGCRTREGHFDEAAFRDQARGKTVRMIEIKLSQGAKPSHGGLLPASKVNREIAEVRGIPVGADSKSPATHPEFSTPRGLLDFVVRLRELCGGKPVGFKLCLGVRSEFMGICKAMLATGITPDFITVDGAEGGTGAAPSEYSDFLGVPIDEALAFVHSCLLGIGLRDEIRVIASGKVATGFDMLTKVALGADMCNAARPFMFSVGCIQALRCHTNRCPTGVATQDPRRARALDVEQKHVRVYNYHHAVLNNFLELAGAMGVAEPGALNPDLLHQRLPNGGARPYSGVFSYLKPGELLGDEIHPTYAGHWRQASAEYF